MRFQATPNRIETVPFQGAKQTVAFIRRAALESQDHFSVRLLAEEIVSNLGSKDYLSEILGIYNFVLSNTRYANDPRTVELVRAPWLIIKELAAGKTPSIDCDDLVALIAALLLSLGRQVRIVVLAFRHAYHKGERQYSHVVLQVKEPKTGAWIILDPVAAEQTPQMLRRVVAVKIYPLA